METLTANSGSDLVNSTIQTIKHLRFLSHVDSVKSIYLKDLHVDTVKNYDLHNQFIRKQKNDDRIYLNPIYLKISSSPSGTRDSVTQEEISQGRKGVCRSYHWNLFETQPSRRLGISGMIKGGEILASWGLPGTLYNKSNESSPDKNDNPNPSQEGIYYKLLYNC